MALGKETDWKKKYYDKLEELETKEKSWKTMETLLKRTLSRLSLAADGIDPALDSNLKDLRDAIRKHSTDARFQYVMEQLSSTLVRLDDERKAQKAPPSAFEVLEKIIDSLELPRGVRKNLNAIRKQMDNEEDQMKAGDFVREIVASINAAVNETAKADKGGFFGKLFGERNEDPEADVAGQEASARSGVDSSEPLQERYDLADQPKTLLGYLVDHIQPTGELEGTLRAFREKIIAAQRVDELQKLTDELARLLSSSLAVESDMETLHPSRLPSLSEVLLQLLEQLSLPPEMNEQIELLKSRLEKEITEEEWESILRDIALLVSEMRVRVQREHRDLEDFLREVTEHLRELDQALQGADEVRKEGHAENKQINTDISDQVSDIQDSVNEAADLNALKKVVSERILTIRGQLEDQRRKADEHETMMKEEMHALSQRVVDLEKETDTLRVRLHDEHNQALIDALTGIPNRMAYDERVSEEYARWKRFGSPLSLLVWDVDFFKKINDTYGHKAGDKVLKIVAERLASQVRQTDFIARYGGEEFVVLMPGTAGKEAQTVADKLRASIAETDFHYREQSVNVTISCGVSDFQEGDDPVSVFERADAALYEAKHAGRNRCVLAS